MRSGRAARPRLPTRAARPTGARRIVPHLHQPRALQRVEALTKENEGLKKQSEQILLSELPVRLDRKYVFQSVHFLFP